MQESRKEDRPLHRAVLKLQRSSAILSRYFMERLTRSAFVLSLILSVVGCSEEDPMTFEFNYDDVIFLDAEDLAEEGIAEAYQALLPKLRNFVDDPVEIEEVIDPDLPSYSIRALGEEYRIFAPDLESREGQDWGRATYAFFMIVNRQLIDSDYQFFAIDGGNDLGGMFLTRDEYSAAIESLENKSDWPYIPTKHHPWFGQDH